MCVLLLLWSLFSDDVPRPTPLWVGLFDIALRLGTLQSSTSATWRSFIAGFPDVTLQSFFLSVTERDQAGCVGKG